MQARQGGNKYQVRGINIEVEKFTPLNTPLETILEAIRQRGLVAELGKVATPPEVQDRSKWCSFHRDHRHITKECTSLKRHVEDLVRNGYLDCFVTEPRD